MDTFQSFSEVKLRVYIASESSVNFVFSEISLVALYVGIAHGFFTPEISIQKLKDFLNFPPDHRLYNSNYCECANRTILPFIQRTVNTPNTVVFKCVQSLRSGVLFVTTS